MRKGQLDDDPRLQGIDANRAGSAFKDDDGKFHPTYWSMSGTCMTIADGRGNDRLMCTYPLSLDNLDRVYAIIIHILNWIRLTNLGRSTNLRRGSSYHGKPAAPE